MKVKNLYKKITVKILPVNYKILFIKIVKKYSLGIKFQILRSNLAKVYLIYKDLMTLRPQIYNKIKIIQLQVNK
jgi:hypothetical protein